MKHTKKMTFNMPTRSRPALESKGEGVDRVVSGNPLDASRH